MVGLVIQGLAREGNVLLVGRGGQVLLRNHPSAVHIQIVAPLHYRQTIVMQRFEMNKREAQNRIRASDRARFDYVRRYHDADWLDPSLYHLVINTGCVPVSTAVDLIIATQQAIGQPSEGESQDE
jgi:cytidylate kinase